MALSNANAISCTRGPFRRTHDSLRSRSFAPSWPSLVPTSPLDRSNSTLTSLQVGVFLVQLVQVGHPHPFWSLPMMWFHPMMLAPDAITSHTVQPDCVCLLQPLGRFPYRTHRTPDVPILCISQPTCRHLKHLPMSGTTLMRLHGFFLMDCLWLPGL